MMIWSSLQYSNKHYNHFIALNHLDYVDFVVYVYRNVDVQDNKLYIIINITRPV